MRVWQAVCSREYHLDWPSIHTIQSSGVMLCGCGHLYLNSHLLHHHSPPPPPIVVNHRRPRCINNVSTTIDWCCHSVKDHIIANNGNHLKYQEEKCPTSMCDAMAHVYITVTRVTRTAAHTTQSGWDARRHTVCVWTNGHVDNRRNNGRGIECCLNWN